MGFKNNKKLQTQQQNNWALLCFFGSLSSAILQKQSE